MSAELQRRSSPAPARGRILETAYDLFYREGIRAVGVDQLIAASSVTKATFYKHYRSKDNLILEYISARHRRFRDEFESMVTESEDAATALRSIVDAAAKEITRAGFRGCAFNNAAAEFPDPLHPLRRIVADHRDWYVDALETLFRAIAHPFPGSAADEVLLARDGALAGAYMGDPVAATAALGRMVSRVMAEAA